MRINLIPTIAGALILAAAPALVATSGPAYAAKAKSKSKTLTSSALNNANDFNHQQQAMAGLLSAKSGASVAMGTFATALKEDNASNQMAVETIANKEHIKLKPYKPKMGTINDLSNLKGSDFEKTFLRDEVRQNENALSQLKQARSQIQKPPMREYLDETIPIVRAHLQMAQNLRHDINLSGNNGGNTSGH